MLDGGLAFAATAGLVISGQFSSGRGGCRSDEAPPGGISCKGEDPDGPAPRFSKARWRLGYGGSD